MYRTVDAPLFEGLTNVSAFKVRPLGFFGGFMCPATQVGARPPQCRFQLPAPLPPASLAVLWSVRHANRRHANRRAD